MERRVKGLGLRRGEAGRRFSGLLASSSVAALLIGAGAPAAWAAQCAISPGTNQSSVSNSAAINCININGITVTGSVTNTGSGTLTPTGSNRPTRTGITVVNNASVGGAIVNAGHITTSPSGTGIFLKNNPSVSGGITNSGTMSVGNGIVMTTVAQFGTASAGGGIVNSGTIIAASAGIAIGLSSRLAQTFYGGISNSGTISVGGSGMNVNTVSTFSGGVSNSGTISAGAIAINFANISIFSGGFNNSGTISAGTVYPGNTAILFNNIASFTGGIGNSGTISSTGGNGILAGGNASACCTAQTVSVSISTFAGGISNSGTISVGGTGIWAGGGAGVPALTSRNTATVTISAFSGGISNSGTISAGGNGIWAGGNAAPNVGVNCCGTNNNNASVMISTFAGGISNSGTIAAGTGNGIFVGGNANVVNAFAFFNAASVAISTFSGGITNSGTISAGGNGIWVGGNPNIDNYSGGNTASVAISAFSGGIGNSGTISAGGNGIFVGGGVSFTSFESPAAGVTNVASVTISTFTGGIGNSGTISAGGAGIWVGGNASINSAGGYQSRNTASVTISTFAGGINNSGTISAGGAGILIGGSASGTNSNEDLFASVTISTFAGGITNSGVIVAHTGIVVNHVATFLGAIVNSGTITGTGGTAIDISAAPSNMTIDITGGAITGNILGAGLTSGDTLNFALGAGTFTYSSSFTNFETVNINSGAVVLNGTGNSATNVNVGVTAAGALAGTGSLDVTGAVTIDSGGALVSGSQTSPFGTFTITGNLAFNSGSGYGIQIAPGTGNNSKTDVNGTASLGGNGTVVVKPQLGYYAAGTFYQILTTTGALTGTFAGFIVDGDHSFAACLDCTNHSPNDVDLDITASGYSLLTAPAGLNQNQQNVLNGMNNAILQGDSIPTGVFNLGNLSGPALINALTQLEGQPATGAQTSTFQLMTDFLNLMTDPSSGGGANPSGGSAPGFAPEQDASLPSDIAQAYAAILSKALPQQQTFDQRWTAWGAAFGGAGKLDGDPSVGSNSVTASDYGYAAGMDYHATPNSVYGFALSGGGTNWTVAQALGSGRSDSFQLGVHDTTHWGPLYVSGALAFANHWFTTNRIAVGDQLEAKFDGQSYAVRGEAGYRYALPVTNAIIGVTPYAALQVQDFHTQGFSETDLTGGGLGLSYASMNATDARSELGARFDNLQVVDGMPLVLRARLAWAHDWVSNPSLGAVFQALPGSNFIVNGAAVPENSALTTAAAELHINANWTAIAKFAGEFAQTAQTYSGTGTLRYSW
jgi:uncharacterized protein with beta-barrel porin domain